MSHRAPARRLRRLALPLVLPLVLPLAACASAGAPSADDGGLRAAYTAFEEAWEAEDADRVMAFFVDDAVAVDPVPPGRWEGAADIREGLVAPAMEVLRDVEIETENLRVHRRGDVGWLTADYVFTSTGPEGRVADPGNLTMVWVLRPGGWRVAAFHASPLVEG